MESFGARRDNFGLGLQTVDEEVDVMRALTTTPFAYDLARGFSCQCAIVALTRVSATVCDENEARWYLSTTLPARSPLGWLGSSWDGL